MVLELLRYLNTVTVDAERKIATVGGGANWETVNDVCDKHGLSTVGPLLNQVSRVRQLDEVLHSSYSFRLALQGECQATKVGFFEFMSV